MHNLVKINFFVFFFCLFSENNAEPYKLLKILNNIDCILNANSKVKKKNILSIFGKLFQEFLKTPMMIPLVEISVC